MNVNFVSETMVLSGAYLIVAHGPTLGGILLGAGVIGGIISFLFSVATLQKRVARHEEIFEIIKGILTKGLQVIHDIDIVNKKENSRTVH